jgi:hypothetical protein
MPRPHRFLFLSIAAIAVAVGIWTLWPRSAITLQNMKRIKAGMTLAEVEQILGGPARDESSGATAFVQTAPGPSRGFDDSRRWIGQEHGVTVWFANQQVISLNIGIVVWPESVLDIFRRWLACSAGHCRD